MKIINKRQSIEKLEVISRKSVLCLGLCLCMGLALPAAQAKENRMQTYLYLHEVDDALFPELERAPGVYAIEATLVKQGADPRIPAPKDSTVALMVSYTLLAAEVAEGSAWHLEIAGLHADGKPRNSVLVLKTPPPKQDKPSRVERSPLKLPEGTIYRAVFWVDLSTILRDKMLLPGDTLTLRYGNATARMVLPASGKLTL